MNESNPDAPPRTAKVKRHGLFSWMWSIPIVAAGIVVYLAYHAMTTRGAVITLTLSSAEGLTVEQTQVKHKDVPLGMVEEVRLAPDMSHVIARLRMQKEAEPFLTDHARFWVVKPRVSAGSLSGLETIVSGSYIEMDPGPPGGKKGQRAFTALDKPPGRRSDEPGRVYVVQAERLGSLSSGAPIYYRDVSVGEVLSYDVGPDSRSPIALSVFVREPYDRYIKTSTRFWNTSGLSLTMGPEGMHLELESLQALLTGGIAFETPAGSESDAPAPDGTSFPLYADKATADAAFYRENLPFVAYFETSIQGLSRGSPVQLFGVEVGSVRDVRLVFDPDKKRMIARVAFDLQPERILTKDHAPRGVAPEEVRRAFRDVGFRATLESSSLITGSKDLALHYAPEVKPSALPKEGAALVVPSDGGGIEGITASLADVATKLDKVPFDDIGRNLDATLQSVRHLSAQLDGDAGPALKQLPALTAQMNETLAKANAALGPGGYGASSDVQRGLERFLNEMNDTARSFRVLADYLDRHPEALIRGRGKGEP